MLLESDVFVQTRSTGQGYIWNVRPGIEGQYIQNQTWRAARSQNENATSRGNLSAIPIQSLRPVLSNIYLQYNAIIFPEMDGASNSDYYKYLKDIEIQYILDPKYMDKQPCINTTQRLCLVNWIVQIHQQLCLPPEVLFLCTHIIDSVLSIRDAPKKYLQLLGIVALQIAYKFETRRCISVGYMAWLCADIYSIEEICAAEWYILDVLGYKLRWPGPITWLCQYEDIKDCSILILSQFLIELTLLDESFLQWPSSQITAASLYLSLCLCSKDWTYNHVRLSGYTTECLTGPVYHLGEVLQNYCQSSTTFTKYKCLGVIPAVEDMLNIVYNTVKVRISIA
ncbi:cyclin-like protein [Jimgerdemannia flammicorona]|uniref:Cyclin-like protein n=1 Tax=Jimgerdemannia flammicorona TaxID=994334 RepID=A0A433DKI1_9FUNG|nr:cyclin-like protein [Jimgerdemannia flammicorona]